MASVELDVNDTLGVTPATNAAAHVPSQSRPADPAGELSAAALFYAEEWHWQVSLGTWLETAEDGARRCSCATDDCPTPGAHPARRNWKSAPTPRPDKMREWWREHPLASVILPTGKSFDVVDVPETAGCLALARLERSDVPLGPVAATPQRRMLFFVLPGAAGKMVDLVRKQGYAPSALDLAVHGEGSYIPAPPTRLGGLGSVQWARRPTVANSWLPDLEAVISPLAYACGRERRMR